MQDSFMQIRLLCHQMSKHQHDREYFSCALRVSEKGERSVGKRLAACLCESLCEPEGKGSNKRGEKD